MVAVFTGLGAGFERSSAAQIGSAGLLGGGVQGRGGDRISVNAATGNLLINRQDEFLVGRGHDVGISRTYNSFGALDENGDHWRQNTDRRIIDYTAATSVSRVSADGSIIDYDYMNTTAGVELFRTTEGSGAYDELSYDGTVWTWKDGASQTAEKYSAYGTDSWRISEQTDNDGNKVTFTYSGAKLTKVTTADGGYLQYVWSGNNISRIDTYAGGTGTSRNHIRTRYAYDTQGRLSSVTTDLTLNSSITDGKVYTTNYFYKDDTKLVETITQTDGSQVDFTYDDSGRVTSIKQAVASGDIRETTLAYASGFTRVYDPSGIQTILYHDAKEQLTRIRRLVSGGHQNTYFAYDVDGNVSSVTDSEGGVTSFLYDSRGNTTRVTDANNVTTYNTYDANNNLTRVKYSGSDANSWNSWQYNHFVYDTENHLTYAISAEGHVTEYTYSATGDLNYTKIYTADAYTISSTSPTIYEMHAWRNGLADRSTVDLSRNLYNAQGQITRTLDYAGTHVTGAANASEGYADTRYTYDSAGRVLSKWVVGLAIETFTYDGLGRLISSKDVNGGTTNIVFNDAATQTVITSEAGLVTTSTYNKAGELIEQSSVGERVETATATYEYDILGRLRIMADGTQLPNGDIGIDGTTARKTYYIYNTAGNLTGEINAYGHVTEYRYDLNRRVIASVRYNNANRISAAEKLALQDPDTMPSIGYLRPSASETDIWQWTAYDAKGQVSHTASGNGSVTAYTYDKVGRQYGMRSYFNKLSAADLVLLKDNSPITKLDQVALPSGNNTKDILIRTFYDRDGRIVGMRNSEGGVTKYTYDEAGRKIEKIIYSDDSTTYSSSFQAVLNSVTVNSGNDITTRSVYDGQGQLRFSIDGLGQVTEYVYHNGVNNNRNIGLVRSTVQYEAPLSSLTTYDYKTVKAAVSGLEDVAKDRADFVIYASNGQPMYTIDSSGSVTHFDYDKNGNVTRSFSFSVPYESDTLPSTAQMNAFYSANWSTSRITSYYYNDAGQLDNVIDAEGYRTSYTYDASGRKITENRYPNDFTYGQTNTENEVVNIRNFGTPVTTTYGYDLAGRLNTVEAPDGVITKTVYNATGTIEYVSEAYGTSDASKTESYYDMLGRVVETRSYVDSSKYSSTLFTYDELGNLETQTNTGGTFDLGFVDQLTSFTYDRKGQVLTQTDSENGETQFEYNAFGQVTKTTNAKGYVSYNYYNEAGQLTASVDAENYATQTTYNSFGEIFTLTRRYREVASASPLSIHTNPLDATTTFYYDKLGRVTQTKDALGESEYYDYDAFGQREKVTNKLGGVTEYTYDDLGQMIQTRVIADVYNSAGTKVASDIINKYEYDSRGNQTKMIEAFGRTEARTTTYVYDKADQLIQKKGDAVQVYTSGADSSAATVTPTEYYTYDWRGNLIESKDANGARTLYYYDGMGRVTHQISPEGTLVRNAYDANSNLIETRVYAHKEDLPDNALGNPPTTTAAEDNAARLTTFTYDRLNRMTDSYVHDVQTARFGSSLDITATTNDLRTQYQYDANGNVTKVIGPNGGETRSEYNKLNRKTRQYDAGGNRTDWIYDANGNVTKETRFGHGQANRITDFTYDDNGNRLSEKRLNVKIFNGSSGEETVNSQISYVYNALGQVTHKTEATGDYIDYTYDSQGRLRFEARSGYTGYKSINQTQTVAPKVQYLYNGLNDVSRVYKFGSIGANASDSHYTYAKGGRLTSVTDGNDFVRSYRYDAKGQLVREEYVRVTNGDSVTEGIGYDFDKEGRVIAQGAVVKSGSTWSWGGNALDTVNTKYNAFGDVSERGINGKYSEKMDYDNAGRLWRTNSGDGADKYFMYDNNGNQSVVFTSDGQDIDNKSIAQILEIWGVSPNGADANKIVTDYEPDVTATITKYDARNLAIEVREPEREYNDASGANLRADFITKRSYNAFGEVVSETDAHNQTINYTYNTMGRRIKVESPEVEVVDANGQVVTDTIGDTNKVRPTEYYYYDISGRLVASKDANGNLTRQTLLAGTGYNGSQALITETIAADGGRVNTTYDIHGNARKVTDQIGRVTTNGFDKMGRLTQINHASGLIDFFSYDGLGQQIAKWNNLAVTGGIVDSTYYDPFDGQITRFVNEALAELEAAQDELNLALDDVQVAHGALVVAVQALEAARDAVDVAAGELEAAEAAVIAATNDLDAARADLAAAQARVVAAQAALDAATSTPEIIAAQAELDAAEEELVLAEQAVIDAEQALEVAQQAEASAAAALEEAELALEQAEEEVRNAREALITALNQARDALAAATTARADVIAERDQIAARKTQTENRIVTLRAWIRQATIDLREIPWDTELLAAKAVWETELAEAESSLPTLSAQLAALNAALPAALAQHDQEIADATAYISDIEYDLAILDDRINSSSSAAQSKTSASYKTAIGKTQAASSAASEISAKVVMENQKASLEAAEASQIAKANDAVEANDFKVECEEIVDSKQTAVDNLSTESQQEAQNQLDAEEAEEANVAADVQEAEDDQADAETAEISAIGAHIQAQNDSLTAEQVLTNAQNALAALETIRDDAQLVRDEASLRYDEIQAVVVAEDIARAEAQAEADRLNLNPTDIIQDKSLTEYDAQGRVILQRNIGGDLTTNSYTWNGSLATSGLGTFGGWTQVTILANGRAQTTQTDVFGHEVHSSDLGGNIATTTYNKAGQAVSRTGDGIDDQSYTYLNTGKLNTLTVTGSNYSSSYLSVSNFSRTSSYKYDKVGNLLNEKLVEETTITYTGGNGYYGGYAYNAGTTHTTTQTLQNSTATYDALGRLKSWSEAGGSRLPSASKFFDYDAQGNIRHTQSNFHTLNAAGNAGALQTQDSWFLFDSMNRITTANGELTNGVIQRGNKGVDIVYNTAGQREYTLTDKMAFSFSNGSSPNTATPTSLLSDGNFLNTTTASTLSNGGFLNTTTTTRESYTYNAGGQVTHVHTASSTTGTPGAGGTLRSFMGYDAFGRQTRQIDYEANGITVAFDNSKGYNNAGQIVRDTSITKRENDTFRTVTNYTYGTGENYALGTPKTITTTYYEKNSNTKVETAGRTSNSFVYHAGAITSATTYDSDITTSKNRITNTSYGYSEGGILLSARINDGRARTVTFTNDNHGQVIRRDEADSKIGGDPHEVWYRFGGKEMGYVGNNGTLNTNYSQSIADRTTTPISGENAGAFRHGSTSSTSHTDFDQAYQAINSYGQGSTYGPYTVRSGDTLQGIAANIYGDSSLWYKIAAANGMTGEAALIEGQSLNLPSGVVKSSHNASTFKPYSPGDIQGDLNPTTPLPQHAAKGKKCGVLGAILLVVVAVVVTIATQGAAAGFFQGLGGAFATTTAATATAAATTSLTTLGVIATGAVAAAAGSIASQAVGVATGIQEKFSWKGVALAAISGGVGAGFGPSANFIQAAAKGAAGSAISQGIGVATGLQDSFSWAGVAAAGAAAGVSFSAGKALGLSKLDSASGKYIGNSNYDLSKGHVNFGSVSRHLTRGAASAIASAATRSAIEGSSFGDNILAAIPDVIGQTLGEAIYGQCFVAGTLIHTSSGLIPIEKIKVGDQVLSRHDGFGLEDVRLRNVARTFRTESQATMLLNIRGEDGLIECIRTTPGHPFARTMTENEQSNCQTDYIDLLLSQKTKLWVPASSLEVGDQLTDTKGRVLEVVKILHDEEVHTVFNFEVSGDHTYFVGETGIWVHNQSVTSPMTKEEADKFIGPLEAKDAHLRDSVEHDPTIHLNENGKELHNLGWLEYVNEENNNSALVSTLDKNGIRKLLNTLGATDNLANFLTGTDLADNDFAIARNILSQNQTVISVEAQLSSINVTVDKTTATGLSLNLLEYKVAVQLGLWNRLEGNNNAPNAISSNSQVNSAAAATNSAKAANSLDVQASPEIRAFISEIAQLTNEAQLGGTGKFSQHFEKFLTVERNASGELVVTNLRTAGEQGAYVTDLLNSNTEAILHDHHYRKFKDGSTLVQKPTGGDHSSLKFRNVPSFVFADQSNRLYEVVRLNNDYKYGQVDNNYNLKSLKKYK